MVIIRKKYEYSLSNIKNHYSQDHLIKPPTPDILIKNFGVHYSSSYVSIFKIAESLLIMGLLFSSMLNVMMILMYYIFQSNLSTHNSLCSHRQPPQTSFFVQVIVFVDSLLMGLVSCVLSDKFFMQVYYNFSFVLLQHIYPLQCRENILFSLCVVGVLYPFVQEK